MENSRKGKTPEFLKRPAKIAAFGLAGALLVGGVLQLTPSAAEEARVIPAPAVDEQGGAGKETAVFAGGCFWGVQGVFQHVNGVINATSGYAGGSKENAHYEMVGSGQTGHAESVAVVFDPRKVSYGHLLQIYFSVAHDPTQLNRQGPDTGTQYRSAIFPTNDEQARIAEAYIAQLNKARVYDAAIVTKIEPAKSFYPAEGYHQDFLTNNPTYPYIVINDLPKIENLKQIFPKDYRADPVLVAESGN
ncbi:peptide-methionine (S)-S-oxide reductase MsrA [Rhizobium sp. BK251]|uniref:peptide-methionine (S)-S-oxide reductase MsrA n=1 Tax=Rhizobium sp. BK251 TaxID=2512125 RepID=UPI001043F2A9|nr:peptide-methionine (S)-S-oxide reductase MsrA [Rhizobium sp. BK251]TCL75725.1 peptide-methionine (S)-S-oxide reductase [Rhizobium sp. BK251]